MPASIIPDDLTIQKCALTDGNRNYSIQSLLVIELQQTIPESSMSFHVPYIKYTVMLHRFTYWFER